MKTIKEHRLQKSSRPAWFFYAAPFVLFLLLTEPGRYFPLYTPYFYIAKTILVGALLWSWRQHYVQDFSLGLGLTQTVISVACGILVLVIWIVPEGYFFQLEQKYIFDPHGLGESQVAFFLLPGVRLLGTSLVVPVMEELFWRSFLMRYLIEPDFRKIPMGAFTWFSFAGVSILFGLEHNRIVVGIAAGVLYGLLLVWQKNLKTVILAHGVTNFGLGVYVLLTGSWWFW